MKASVIALAIAGALSASGAFAQAPGERGPNMPALENTIPEKMAPRTEGDPPATGSTGTLSDRLNRSDGVIRPDVGATPDMTAPPPVPNPGVTPVIPTPSERTGGAVQAK